jgi:hypothetical protein
MRPMSSCRCEQFSVALQSCTDALELDSTYFSAMRMRAACKTELFDFEGACKDWDWVIDRRS